MRKKLNRLFIVLILLLFVSGIASAAGIKTSGLNEAKLYELYAQVHAQLQYKQLKNAGLYNSNPNYDDIERNPASHKNENIYFPGKIIQVLEGSGSSEYRIAMNGSSGKVFLIDYERPEGAERLLVDDRVWVYATFKKLETYTSTTNLSVTVPYCTASLIIREITDKGVLEASREELEDALPRILESLKKVIPKDKGYSKLTKINYDEFARLEDLHQDDPVTATGKVLQVLEGTYRNTIRLAVDSDSDKVLYLTFDPDLLSIRVLEDDNITIKGKYTGLYTYSSIRGGEITIPSASVESVEVKGYTVPKKIAKDKNGNYVVTKKVYEDYARRPNEHKKDSISFTAKVIQVIEGDTVSAYRMAVDSDSNYVMYVKIANSDRTIRILEDDKVNVVATFDGLLSYESTMGATITIPQCIATKIDIPGRSTTSAFCGPRRPRLRCENGHRAVTERPACGANGHLISGSNNHCEMFRCSLQQSI